MNNQEAKFILGAYRPDGRDATDPMFASALAQAEKDPEFRAWFDRQRKFDATLTAKLSEIAPPAELRGAILTGARASRPRRNWWVNPVWLAAAAAVVLLFALTVQLGTLRSPSLADLADYATKDLAEAHGDHVGFPEPLANVQAQLANADQLRGGMRLDLDELRRKHCRAISIGGKQVFEICFLRNGTWYHLYAGRRSDFSGVAETKSLLATHGEYSTAAWSDATNVYALVAHAGQDALRRLL